MRKVIIAFLSAIFAWPIYADIYHARYGVSETFDFWMYNTDGTYAVSESDSGTEVTVACNEGAETTATNDFVDEGTFYSITLTATEMQCERVVVVVQGTTIGGFIVQTFANASAMTPTYEANVASITDGAIAAADFAAGAIDASAIATDAIGANEIATDAIGANEIAASAVGASEIATDAIGAAEIASDVASTEFLNLQVNAVQISGDSTAADNLELGFDDTAGAVPWLGIADQGTAQSATSTTVVLRAATPYGADNVAIGATLWVYGSTQGYWQHRAITDYDTATDTATVAAWDVTPSGTLTYKVFGTAPSAAGAGATAAEVWSYSTRILTALDEDSTTIDLDATSINTGSISTGAIQAVDFATGAIDATAIAADAIGASELAADAIGSSEIAADAIGAAEVANATIDAATFAAGAIDAAAIAADAIASSELAASAVDEFWDEPQSGHATAGTFGLYLDAAISGVSTGGASAATIADAVWDEVLSGHLTGGTTGAALNTASGAAGLDAAGVRAAIGLASANLDTQLSTIDDFVDTEVATVVTQTGAGAIRTAVGLASANLDTQLSTIDDFIDTEIATITTQTGAGAIRNAVGLASANLDTQLTAIDDYVDTEIATLVTRVGTPAGASLAADIAALPTSTIIRDAILDAVLESGVSVECGLSLMLAYAAGPWSNSGLNTTYRDPSNVSNRITVTRTSDGSSLSVSSFTCP